MYYQVIIIVIANRYHLLCLECNYGSGVMGVLAAGGGGVLS